jgi:hypothetical protein
MYRYSTYIADHERPLPAEERLVEIGQLTPAKTIHEKYGNSRDADPDPYGSISFNLLDPDPDQC